MKHNILYSFRRCPFAIRARWALLNTHQEVELREVDLKNKPIELIRISKKATVPVLQTTSNKVIDESIEIMIWCLKKSKKHELLGDNNTFKEIFNLIDTNDNRFKNHLDRFKYASRFDYQDLEAHHDSGMEILLSLNNRLKCNADNGKSLFLVNAQETLADWSIWPFIRQFRMVDLERFDQNNEIKFLKSWLNYYLNHKNYPIVMKKYDAWNKAIDPLFFGLNINGNENR